MNELQLQGSWNEMKGKFKKTFGRLAEDDLAYAHGQEDQLVGRIQKRLAKTRDEVRKILQQLQLEMAKSSAENRSES